MPFRLNEFRAKVQFMSFSRMPGLITQAAKKRGYVSNTQYINMVLCAALSRDLGLDEGELIAELPPPTSAAAHFLKKHENASLHKSG